eukprot:TRINITY_DN107172_c0_g1_i1.p1 TRINITY_DN107172_c0_g1~~TRINITY_DN107172_c0_g1_i1.p1  ORF type:complete len:610 (+),score=103.42 TRINITY_DN107172_c0_g1_i1:40-1830(+)
MSSLPIGSATRQHAWQAAQPLERAAAKRTFGAEPKPAPKSPLEQRRTTNWELLDLVLGSWTGSDGCTYSVQLEGSTELDSCLLFTTRPDGKTLCQKGAIRIWSNTVMWGTSYTLDRRSASSQRIRWAQMNGSQEFGWNRKIGKIEKDELRRKVISEREACFGMAATAVSELLDGREAAIRRRAALRKKIAAEKEACASGLVLDEQADFENESDDDDIAHYARCHLDSWSRQLQRRPLPVNEIRWCHDSICIRFRNGKLLVDTLADMLSGRLSPEDLPPLQVVLHEDQLFAVTGNRRLWVLNKFSQLTGRKIFVTVKCYPPAAMGTTWCRQRFTTQNQGLALEFLHRRSTNHKHSTMQEALCEAKHFDAAERLTSLENRLSPGPVDSEDTDPPITPRGLSMATPPPRRYRDDYPAETPLPPNAGQEQSEDQIPSQVRSVLETLLSSPEEPAKQKTESIEVGRPSHVAGLKKPTRGSVMLLPSQSESAEPGALAPDTLALQKQVLQRLQQASAPRSAFQHSARVALESFSMCDEPESQQDSLAQHSWEEDGYVAEQSWATSEQQQQQPWIGTANGSSSIGIPAAWPASPDDNLVFEEV